MKTKTSIKAGVMPLRKCKNVSITRKRNGNLIKARCPFHGFWVNTKGWFPRGSKVFWDDDAGQLTTLLMGGAGAEMDESGEMFE